MALRSRVLRGLAWKGASQIVLQLSRLAFALALARLLTPREYGVAGMVLVFSAFIIPFADLGLGAALVQRRILRSEDTATAFWTSVAVGCGFTVLGIALAGPLATFYGEPRVEPLFQALSSSFLITSLGSTHRSLLVRTINFRSLEIRQLAAMAVAAPLALVVAARGHGPWALVVLELTLASVSTVLLWILSTWRPTFAYSWVSLRALGAFGGNVLGARLLGDVTQMADKLLIGRFLGAAPLGSYALSYNIVLSPFSRIVTPIQEVLFPALSHMQEDLTRMGSVWLRTTRVVAALSLPATLGLVAVSSDFVAVALGERWHAAARIIQILAWVGLLQAIQGMNQTLLQAADRTGTLIRFSFIALAVNVTAFIIGLQWGALGVAAAYALSSTLLFLVFTWVTARVARVSILVFAKNLSGVAQASSIMFLCVLAARALLIHEGVPAGARLALVAIGGAAVFLAAAALRAPDLADDLRSLRKQRPGPQAPQAD